MATTKTKTKTNDILAKIKAQYEANKPKAKKEKWSKEDKIEFLKKYYNVSTEGDHVFRILPPLDGSSPFVETYFHHIKVNGQWVKLYCPKKNDGEKCPCCEAEEALKSTGESEDFILSRTYQASLFYVVKGIDRNKVEDGVKFFRFKHSYKQTGVFDKIVPIVGRKGEIWDPIKGRDLLITAAKTTGQNGGTYVAVTTVMYDDESRLVEDDETLKSLVNDKTTWRDVYKSKPTEYLQQVVEGKAPYWDENTKKMVTPQGQGHGKKIVSVDTEETTTTKTVVEDSIDDQLTRKTNDVFDSPEVQETEDREVEDDLPF